MSLGVILKDNPLTSAIPTARDSMPSAYSPGRGAAFPGQLLSVLTCQSHERYTERGQGPLQDPSSRDEGLCTGESIGTGADPHVDSLLLGKSLFVSDEKRHRVVTKWKASLH